MAVVYSWREYQTLSQRRVRNCVRSVRTSHEGIADKVGEAADQLLSGGVSSESLRKVYNYPFARAQRKRKKKAALLPKLPINTQTGELRRSRRKIRENYDELGQTFRIQFTSTHAIVLSPTGTRFMIPRGFWEELVRRAETIQTAELADTAQKARGAIRSAG